MIVIKWNETFLMTWVNSCSIGRKSASALCDEKLSAIADIVDAICVWKSAVSANQNDINNCGNAIVTKSIDTKLKWMD